MTDAGMKEITFKIQRYNPENDSAPYMQAFVVPSFHGMTVLDGLIYIKENLDSTLAFRTSCRMGICGSCGMLVNNYPHLACHTQIEEFKSNTLTVKPLPNVPLIKDLIADLSSVFEHHKSVKPYVIREEVHEDNEPTAEYAELPHELDGFQQFAYCVKCGICVAACPTSASDALFLGPQALAQCFRYCADNRDAGEEERFVAVDTDHGIWRCHLAGACSDACPKGVDPALAIQLLKRRMSSRSLRMSQAQNPAPLVVPPSEIKEKIPYPDFTVNIDERKPASEVHDD